MERYFVYDLIDPRTGQTFYVGKGCKNRPAEHTKQAKAGVHSRKCDLIRSILDDGLTVKVKIAQRFADEAEAYAFEVERIAEFGLANLTNVLPGGNGPYGCMSRAVTLAEQMPKAMIYGIWRVLAFASKGLRVSWGGMDVTKFANQSLQRLVGSFGLEAVQERFAAAGLSLLTEQNNGIR